MVGKNKYLEEYTGLLADLLDNVPVKPLFASFTTKDAESQFQKSLSNIQYYSSKFSPNRISLTETMMRHALTEISNGRPNHPVFKFEAFVRVDLVHLITKYPELTPYLSVSGDGYLREKAVVHWSKINTAFELSLLLRRLNDWVPQVSLAAISKFEELIALPSSKSGLSSEIILDCMDLILDRDRYGRSKEIAFRVLNQLLNYPEVRSKLDNHVMNSPLDSAARYFREALLLGLFAEDIEELCINAKHATVRRTALLVGLRKRFSVSKNAGVITIPVKSQFDIEKTLHAALADKSTSVKRMALDYILDSKPTPFHNEATYSRLFETDKVSIIDRCVYGLKTLGFDKIDDLRKKIEAGDNSKTSMAVLARYGNKQDGNLIYEQRLKVTNDRELEVLGYAARLNNLSAIQDLRDYIMNEPNDYKASLAIAWLHRAKYSMSYEQILESLEKGDDVILRGFRKSIHKLPAMKLAIVIAKMLNLNVEANYNYLWGLLGKKRNRGAFLPSREEETLLRSTASFLSEKNIQTLQRALGLRLTH